MNPAPPVTSTRIRFPSIEIGRKLAKLRKPPILLRNNCIGRRDGPLDAQAGVGPMDAAVVLGGIHVVDLIEDYAVGLQRTKAVGEPCRDQELLSRRLAQLDCQMLAVTSGRAPQIHDDIEDPPSQNANQLGLRERRNLEVQAADGSGGARPRLVILDQFVTDPRRAQIVPPCPRRKIPPSIPYTLLP